MNIIIHYDFITEAVVEQINKAIEANYSAFVLAYNNLSDMKSAPAMKSAPIDRDGLLKILKSDIVSTAIDKTIDTGTEQHVAYDDKTLFRSITVKRDLYNAVSVYVTSLCRTQEFTVCLRYRHEYLYCFSPVEQWTRQTSYTGKFFEDVQKLIKYLNNNYNYRYHKFDDLLEAIDKDHRFNEILLPSDLNLHFSRFVDDIYFVNMINSNDVGMPLGLFILKHCEDFTDAEILS